MSFLKRGWLSVKRKPGKTILLFLIIFILSNVIAGAISITQASKAVEKNIKARMGAICSVMPDYEKLDKWYEENPDSDENPITPVSKDLIDTIGQSPYLKYYDYSIRSSLGETDSFKLFTPEHDEDTKMFDDPWRRYYGLNVMGVQYAKVAMIEEGKMRLLEGSVFTDDQIEKGENVCLIAKPIADVNNVKVGDTIDPTSYVMDDEKSFSDEKQEIVISTSQAFPLKVIGIFEVIDPKPKDNQDGKKRDPYQETYEADRKGNLIIVPNAVTDRINRYNFEESQAQNKHMDDMKYEDTQWFEPMFYLKDPKDIEAFVEETNTLLPEFMTTVTSVDNYKSIAAPVEKTSKLANIVFWVALVATILIVTLVILLFLRDRKHELGIYLSLGESKGKVIGQILTEVLIIGIIAITLSLFTGHYLAKNLSGGLLERNASAGIDENHMRYYMFEDDESITSEEVLEAYEVKLSGGYVALFYGVGLATIILATVIPMLYILRLNPKKIMM